MRLLIPLILMTVQSANGMTFNPSLPDDPSGLTYPDIVRVTGLPVGKRTNYNGTTVLPICVVNIFGVNGTPTTYSWSVQSTTGGDGARYCAGINTTTNDGQAVAEHIVGALGGVKRPYTGPVLTCWNAQYPAWQGGYLYYFTWESFGECPYSQPAPVVCTVRGPGDILHPLRTVGGTGPDTSDVVRITCSSKTTVVVTTPGDIQLRSGGAKLSSRLYVGRAGDTSYKLDVAETAVVPVISRILGLAGEAGEYSGSGVITVTWD